LKIIYLNDTAPCVRLWAVPWNIYSAAGGVAQHGPCFIYL